ncbi:MAG TPA: DUF177 domain-containing protein [Pyrinomonadaceae bacterium]|nr:DUF177 domain-containing protein [Pyrinomonadaceae bacterium]
MIIDLTALKEKRTSFDFVLPADEINLEGEAVKLNDDVKIEGKLIRGIAQTDIEGGIFTDVELECSRCLQPVRDFLEIPFEAVFVTPENYTEAAEVQVAAEDLEVSVFEGDKIDLAEVAREQILLALPTRVFCREDCKGFCQKCGANRNLINCNCEEKEIDPRWQGLRELKIK